MLTFSTFWRREILTERLELLLLQVLVHKTLQPCRRMSALFLASQILLKDNYFQKYYR